MSSEGVLAVEDIMTVSDGSEITDMANGIVHKDEDSPRESVPPMDNGVEQGKEYADSATSTESCEEEAKTRVSDDGDHGKPAADSFAEPDEELRNRIIQQVEFYFSDVNISKDAFLLGLIRRSKMGFVSLKLIANFKKMKRFTKDVRVVAFSLRQSQELEMNDQGTKVRRRNPLPQFDETTPFRTVVAVNLEQKSPTVESVAKEFSNCHGIALIRIIRPGTTIPSDVNKYANKHREIGTTVCAVIEFDKEEQAKKACKMMTNTEDWRNGRRVVLLSIQKQRREKQDSNGQNSVSAEDEGGKGRKKKNAVGKKNHEDHKPAERTSSGSSNGSDGDGSGNPQSQPGNTSPDSKSKRASPCTSPGSNKHSQHHGRSHPKDATSQNGVHRPNAHMTSEMFRSKADTSPGESSPWVQRRLRAAQDARCISSPMVGQASGDGPSPRNSKLLNQVGVLRQPKGPDGTKGFSELSWRKPQCSTIA